jgi:hypothetical protein
MAKVKTWVWVVIGIVTLGVLGIVSMAAAGLWFVRSHINVQTATAAVVAPEFDSVRAKFSGQRPLIELDEHGDFLRANTDRAAGSVRPHTLHVMVFDNDDDKVIRMELPFWLLRLKSGGTRFSLGDGDVDLARLRLTVEDLERYGPTLILDHKDRRGAHVLVWSE